MKGFETRSRTRHNMCPSRLPISTRLFIFCSIMCLSFPVVASTSQWMQGVNTIYTVNYHTVMVTQNGVPPPIVRTAFSLATAQGDFTSKLSLLDCNLRSRLYKHRAGLRRVRVSRVHDLVGFLQGLAVIVFYALSFVVSSVALLISLMAMCTWGANPSSLCFTCAMSLENDIFELKKTVIVVFILTMLMFQSFIFSSATCASLPQVSVHSRKCRYSYLLGRRNALHSSSFRLSHQAKKLSGMLLLLSGDVESNPGPNGPVTNKSTSDPVSHSDTVGAGQNEERQSSSVPNGNPALQDKDVPLVETWIKDQTSDDVDDVRTISEMTKNNNLSSSDPAMFTKNISTKELHVAHQSFPNKDSVEVREGSDHDEEQHESSRTDANQVKSIEKQPHFTIGPPVMTSSKSVNILPPDKQNKKQMQSASPVMKNKPPGKSKTLPNFYGLTDVPTDHINQLHKRKEQRLSYVRCSSHPISDEQLTDHVVRQITTEEPIFSVRDTVLQKDDVYIGRLRGNLETFLTKLDREKKWNKTQGFLEVGDHIQQFYLLANQLYRAGGDCDACLLCGRGKREESCGVPESHIFPRCLLKAYRDIHCDGQGECIFDPSTNQVMGPDKLTLNLFCSTCEAMASPKEKKLRDLYLTILACNDCTIEINNAEWLRHILATIMFRGMLFGINFLKEFQNDMIVLMEGLSSLRNYILGGVNPDVFSLYLLPNGPFNPNNTDPLYIYDLVLRTPCFTTLIRCEKRTFLYTKFDCFHCVLPLDKQTNSHSLNEVDSCFYLLPNNNPTTELQGTVSFQPSEERKKTFPRLLLKVCALKTMPMEMTLIENRCIKRYCRMVISRYPTSSPFMPSVSIHTEWSVYSKKTNGGKGKKVSGDKVNGLVFCKLDKKEKKKKIAEAQKMSPLFGNTDPIIEQLEKEKTAECEQKKNLQRRLERSKSELKLVRSEFDKEKVKNKKLKEENEQLKKQNEDFKLRTRVKETSHGANTVPSYRESDSTQIGVLTGGMELPQSQCKLESIILINRSLPLKRLSQITNMHFLLLNTL